MASAVFNSAGVGASSTMSFATALASTETPALQTPARNIRWNLAVQGEGRFPCMGCEKRFNSSQALYQHKRGNHPELIGDRGYQFTRQEHASYNEPAERRFKCPSLGCGKAYASSAGLYQHKRAAHPYLIKRRKADEEEESPPPYPQGQLQSQPYAGMSASTSMSSFQHALAAPPTAPPAHPPALHRPQSLGQQQSLGRPLLDPLPPSRPPLAQPPVTLPPELCRRMGELAPPCNIIDIAVGASNID